LASRGVKIAARLTEREVMSRAFGDQLPAGVSGVGLGEAVSDRQRRAEALQRRRQVALSPLHVADPPMRRRQVALPAGEKALARSQSSLPSRCSMVSRRRKGSSGPTDGERRYCAITL